MSKKELLEVDGGGYWGLLGIAAGALSFVVGFFDGLTRPFKCR